MRSTNFSEFRSRTKQFINLIYSLPDVFVSEEAKKTIVRYFIQNWFESDWRGTFTRERYMDTNYDKSPLLTTNNITERLNKSIDAIQFNSHLNRTLTNLLTVTVSEFLEAHNTEVRLIEDGEIIEASHFPQKSKNIVAKGIQIYNDNEIYPASNWKETGEWKALRHDRQAVQHTDDFFTGEDTEVLEDSEDECEDVHVYESTEKLLKRMLNGDDNGDSLQVAKELIQILNSQALDMARGA